MKNRILTLGIIALTSIIVVALLHKYSVQTNRYSNKFSRLLPPHFASYAGAQELLNASFTFIGNRDGHIYLQCQPLGKVVSVDTLSFQVAEAVQFDSVLARNEMNVSDAGLFVANATTRSVSFTANWLQRDVNFQGQKFTAWTAGDSTFVFRQIDSRYNSNILTSLSADGLDSAGSNSLLTHQADSVFSSDGILNFCPAKKWFVYTYFYRNQFFCFNRNLAFTLAANTIDTTTTAKISVTRLKDRITMSKPPLLVNRATCISANHLFVNSNLRSDNERPETWPDHSVIDVYDLADEGAYRLSFYLDKYKNMRPSQFYVHGNILFALYGRHLVYYRLKPIS